MLSLQSSLSLSPSDPGIFNVSQQLYTSKYKYKQTRPYNPTCTHSDSITSLNYTHIWFDHTTQRVLTRTVLQA